MHGKQNIKSVLRCFGGTYSLLLQGANLFLMDAEVVGQKGISRL